MSESSLKIELPSFSERAVHEQMQAATQGEIDEAFEAARSAQKLWAKTPLSYPTPILDCFLLHFCRLSHPVLPSASRAILLFLPLFLPPLLPSLCPSVYSADRAKISASFRP